MLEEAIAGFRAMPIWVQGFMAFFALMVVVMIVEPRLRHRRVAKRFAALAAGTGATVKPGTDEFTQSFEVERDARRFTVRRELHESTRGTSYRGPRGHLLISETPIAGSGWQLHGVDIAEDGALPLVGMRPFKTGDATFDRRFTIWQDGGPVREGWLDDATRGAVTAFFDAAPISGTVRVQESLLQYVVVAPKGMDATALEKMLPVQSALALAFERAAGWRGPVA